MPNTTQYRYRWWILFAVSFAVLLINIEITAVNLIIAPLAASLHISLANSHWIISSYLLTFSGLVIAGGRLGDIFGHKTMLITGVSIFIIASLIGGLAQGLWTIIAGRILQGVGAAIMWPSTTALAFKSFPKHQKGIAVGTIISVTGFAISIGPTLGGFFATTLSWRWVFLFNVPIGLLIIILGWLVVKDAHTNKNEKFDFTGTFLLAVGLGALTLAIDLCDHLPRDIFIILGLLAVAIAALHFFVKTENNHRYPLLNLAILKNVQFITNCIARAMLVSVLYPFLFIMGLYLQKTTGFSSLKAGIIFLPMTLCMGFLSPLGGRIVDKAGAKTPATIGLLAFIIGLTAISFINVNTPLYLLYVMFAIIGIGYSLATPAFLTASMSAVSEAHAGIASAIFFMLSIFGGLIGVTIAGVILGHYHQLFGDNSLIHTVPMLMWLSAGTCLIALGLTRNPFCRKY